MRWLDLAGTAVSDAGLARLSDMPNLIRLHLERTRIGDAGLARLATLNQLEYLNLYGTEITDAGLEQLQDLPKLKQIYLWQTKVTPEAGKSFAEAHTDHDQLQHWQEEIDQLNAKIRDAHISVDLGTMQPAVASTSTLTNAAASNTVCPVSGKPVDPSKTVIHNGVVVAFCCDDCKAKFQKDPTPYLPKL
jgi:YHS domain-containing protein